MFWSFQIYIIFFIMHLSQDIFAYNFVTPWEKLI